MPQIPRLGAKPAPPDGMVKPSGYPGAGKYCGCDNAVSAELATTEDSEVREVEVAA
ncbi:MAG: hypothetical protein ACK5CA_12840 [Cyanobacteriota bacterium]